MFSATWNLKSDGLSIISYCCWFVVLSFWFLCHNTLCPEGFVNNSMQATYKCSKAIVQILVSVLPRIIRALSL